MYCIHISRKDRACISKRGHVQPRQSVVLRCISPSFPPLTMSCWKSDINLAYLLNRWFPYSKMSCGVPASKRANRECGPLHHDSRSFVRLRGRAVNSKSRSLAVQSACPGRYNQPSTTLHEHETGRMWWFWGKQRSLRLQFTKSVHEPCASGSHFVFECLICR